MESNDDLRPGVVIKPNVNFQNVKDIAFNLYGFEVSEVVELNGYDDKNYRITVRNETNQSENLNHEYVLKIINSLDSKKPQLFEAQTALILHLRKNGILCPKPIATKDNLYFKKVKLSSGEHVIRLLEFIKGTILYNVPCTPNLLRQAGEFVARLDIAMKNFEHAVYEEHKSLWMLESVPKIREYVFAVPDEERRKLVLAVVKEFEDRVLSISDTLESGMIHGDFNEQNIIVEEKDDHWRIKAVIDFGDCHRTCYLYEFAITMTYMMLQARDINAGGYVLAGYSSVREVPEIKFSLLKICTAARLCQSLVLGAYTNLQDPNNAYVLVTAAHGWKLLETIWEEPEENLLARWKSISKTCIS